MAGSLSAARGSHHGQPAASAELDDSRRTSTEAIGIASRCLDTVRRATTAPFFGQHPGYLHIRQRALPVPGDQALLHQRSHRARRGVTH